MIASAGAVRLLRKQKLLRRQLQNRPDLLSVRIAFLCGSTVNEVAALLELLLLEQGIQPIFYFSDYNKYFEEAVLDTARLIEFRPDIIFVYTSSVSIQNWPTLETSELDLVPQVAAETMRFAAIWEGLRSLGAVVIQNNFELPAQRLFGNYDAVCPAGRTRFTRLLNTEFAREAASRTNLLIHDLNGVAASMGLKAFHDADRWYSYKMITTPEASLEVAKSSAAMVLAIYGRTRKCLVLDLDNTLWGGVIGDDGPDKIKIGRETAEAEAFTAFQEYCLQLRRRGILLAVCSKNSDAIARQGFEHPDSVLMLEHFACFKANWEPKHENIKAIASELNIGLDSLVFVDDNPAEREIVGARLPDVAVPDVGSDVSKFISVLEEGRYFEPVRLSREDLNRAEQYQENAQRAASAGHFQNYDDYLESLEMHAEVAPFKQVYLDRITQLINKTNQFNLTTRRYTQAQVEAIAVDPSYISLYGKLTDKFGDNGMISVIIGRKESTILHIDLWIMSCRVLKRGMETLMLDALVAECQSRGISEIYGYYIQTERNGLVAGHYTTLGFKRSGGDDQHKVFRLDISHGYQPQNKHIKEYVHE